MIKQGCFGVQEAVCLIVITISSKVLFTSPGILERHVGTASWYTVIIQAFIAIIAFTFVYLLLKRFPGKDIIEIFDICMGPVIGFAFSALFALAFFSGGAIILREFAEVSRVYSLPNTPSGVIVGTFVMGVGVLCFLGIENIARFSKLSAYVLLFGLLALLVLSWQNYDFRRLFPILGHGIGSIADNGVLRSSVYDEVVILAVLAGPLQGVKNIKKAGYMSLIISGILISCSFIAITATFTFYVAQEATSPMFQMTKLIDYGRFFQRLDPVFFFMWNISTLITGAALFYCFLFVYCRMFRLQKLKPLVLPAAIILFAAAMIPNDLASVATIYVQATRQYGWAVFYLLPVIVLITAKIRKKKGAAQNV